MRVVVRALHRNTVYVDWADVDQRRLGRTGVVQLRVDECRPLATDP